MSKSLRLSEPRPQQVNLHDVPQVRYVMAAGRYVPDFCTNCWGFERAQTRDSFQNLILVRCPVCQTAPLAVAR